MTTKSKRRDFTQVAFAVAQIATGEAEDQKKLTGRKANSSKGGKKGGKSRMEALTDEQRSELARQAAKVRWGDAAPATKTGAAKPRSTKQH